MCRILQTVVVCFVLLYLVSAYEFVEGGRRGEGESCDENGKAGTCTRITKCHVYTQRGEWWKLKICDFVDYSHDTMTVICCPARESTTTTTTTTTTTPKPIATTPPMGDATTEYVPPVYDYVMNDVAPDGCSYLQPNLTTEPIGKRSFDSKYE
ncbi:uncharacterized protein [Choristoneura fumiferana]|uniref:uncharacterized protein n=1 Tax=Choristoneura fumiferana TaxID=7141 RepID=UPI003D157DFD